MRLASYKMVQKPIENFVSDFTFNFDLKIFDVVPHTFFFAGDFERDF